jgi:hypothetical protein
MVCVSPWSWYSSIGSWCDRGASCASILQIRAVTPMTLMCSSADMRCATAVTSTPGTSTAVRRGPLLPVLASNCKHARGQLAPQATDSRCCASTRILELGCHMLKRAPSTTTIWTPRWCWARIQTAQGPRVRRRGPNATSAACAWVPGLAHPAGTEADAELC